MPFEMEALEKYLRANSDSRTSIKKVSALSGDSTGPEALKKCGYGKPLYLEVEGSQGVERLVLHMIRRNGFGRERIDDRVAAVWLDFATFNRLEKHVEARDMILLRQSGEMESVADGRELLLLTKYKPGNPYVHDLQRIAKTNEVTDEDLDRVKALSDYLVEIHRVTHDDPLLWRRRLRDLVGDGEGIMGLTDSYPTNTSFTSTEELREIEEAVNKWRWRLKPMTHRLCQVHGDFHPFNIVFEDKTGTFHVLDRSRGAWGEAADDLSCMTINYIFFSLLHTGRFKGNAVRLHNLFWNNYMEGSGDDEIQKVIQPWLAWRALVLASPRWYPDLKDSMRRVLLNLARNVLQVPVYNHNVAAELLRAE